MLGTIVINKTKSKSSTAKSARMTKKIRQTFFYDLRVTFEFYLS